MYVQAVQPCLWYTRVVGHEESSQGSAVSKAQAFKAKTGSRT